MFAFASRTDCGLVTRIIHHRGQNTRRLAHRGLSLRPCRLQGRNHPPQGRCRSRHSLWRCRRSRLRRPNSQRHPGWQLCLGRGRWSIRRALVSCVPRWIGDNPLSHDATGCARLHNPCMGGCASSATTGHEALPPAQKRAVVAAWHQPCSDCGVPYASNRRSNACATQESTLNGRNGGASR
jgi:hypothetical protein